MRKTDSDGWPSDAPYDLGCMIQEQLPSRFTSTIACILLNQSRRTAAWDQTLWRLLGTWASPAALAQADGRLEEMLRPHGFQNVKAKRLRDFSAAWLDWDGVDLSTLPGVGQYAVDSDDIFYFGERPNRDWIWDKELRAFLEKEEMQASEVPEVEGREVPVR